MIYRALIESQYNNYQYKVKIPALDTKTYNATVCSTPGVNATLRSGDAVFVTFEKNSNDNAVILGTLYNEKNAEKKSNINAATIETDVKAILPHETFIGDVTDEQIAFLKNLEGDVQFAINTLTKVSDEHVDRWKTFDLFGDEKSEEILQSLNVSLTNFINTINENFKTSI